MRTALCCPTSRSNLGRACSAPIKRVRRRYLQHSVGPTRIAGELVVALGVFTASLVTESLAAKRNASQCP